MGASLTNQDGCASIVEISRPYKHTEEIGFVRVDGKWPFNEFIALRGDGEVTYLHFDVTDMESEDVLALSMALHAYANHLCRRDDDQPIGPGDARARGWEDTVG